MMPRDEGPAATPEAVVMPCEPCELPAMLEPPALTIPFEPLPNCVPDEDPFAVTMPWREPDVVTVPEAVVRRFEVVVEPAVPVDVESEAMRVCADLSELTTGPSLVPS